jgi:hypothetical protein
MIARQAMNPAGFPSGVYPLTAPEQSEALHCVLKKVAIPKSSTSEIFELQEFLPGSQNRKKRPPGLDSNKATLRLTAVKFNLSGFAEAETNRRETASYDKAGQVKFTFSFQFLSAFWRYLAQVACHLHDTLTIRLEPIRS